MKLGAGVVVAGAGAGAGAGVVVVVLVVVVVVVAVVFVVGGRCCSVKGMPSCAGSLNREEQWVNLCDPVPLKLGHSYKSN